MSWLGDFGPKARLGARSLVGALRRFGLALADIPWVQRNAPMARWLPAYDQRDLPGDVTAGIIVAIMLVPQSMAYALLAGMPPQAGLYASIVPLMLYAVFGSSRALAVGPVAIVSLMVASALAPLANPGSAEYVGLALTLALMSGAILVALGALRVGFVVNFLSHPVLAGFTSAAAIVIGFSQLKDLLGISLPGTHFVPELVWQALAKSGQINVATVLIGGASIAMLVWRAEITARLQERGLVTPAIAAHVPRAMPLVVVGLFTALTGLLGLATWAGVKVVGAIPIGLPPIALPPLGLAQIQSLVVPALLISLVGFLESVSVAKSLASRKRQVIEPNQELIGLGAANIGAALTGGFPVTGGFSRSVVNFSAGANTPLASLITAGLIVVAILALTPLLYHLPRAVLAGIVVVAVANLVDFASFRRAWAYDRADGASYLGTFAAVLMLGVDAGIMVGIALSLALHLWRTSKPHIAIVGRVGETEHFRNVRRHPVTTDPRILLMRIDESLYFANAAFLEERVLEAVAGQPVLEHFVLICSAVNLIDASALETLEDLRQRLSILGITMHLAEVKGPVMDRLADTGLIHDLAPGRVFLSTHEALSALKRPIASIAAN